LGYASREAWQVLDAKRAYWAKTLSLDAWGTNISVMFNILDFYSFWLDYTVSDTLLSSVISQLFFDIPLSDTTPWNLVWDIELPTPEEFLKGLKLKFIKISLPEAVIKMLNIPEFQAPSIKSFLENVSISVPRFIETVFTTEVSNQVKKTMSNKAVYGRTRYGKSYYDPTAVRDFLRSTYEAWMQKRGTYEEVKRKLRLIAETLNIYEGVVEDIFNRLSMFDAVKDTCFTWDFAWWDRTSWGPEERHSPVTPLLGFRDWSGAWVEVEYRTLFDVQAGGWWDLSMWDMFYWTFEDVQKHDIYRRWEQYGDTYLSIFRDSIVFMNRSHIIATATAIANYQPYEGMKDFMRSPRTETYALPYGMRLRLESITTAVVKRFIPNIDPYTLRLYKTAVLELFGQLTAQHRWGLEAFRSMTSDELKEFWINRWVNDGLRRDVLEALYGVVIKSINAFGRVRAKDRLRFIRRFYRVT